MSTPVLIVGGGVGGLAASTLLAHQGINSLLVERRREIFLYPKARNLTFPLLTGSAGAAWARAAELVSAALGVSIDVHSIGVVAEIADLDGRWAGSRGWHLMRRCWCVPMISSGGVQNAFPLRRRNPCGRCCAKFSASADADFAAPGPGFGRYWTNAGCVA